MAGRSELKVGQRFRTTRTFTDKWLHDVIQFDGGLHEPITVPEGAEGVVHSLRSPDGNGYFDARYPDVHGWPEAAEGGTRVQTSTSDIAML